MSMQDVSVIWGLQGCDHEQQVCDCEQGTDGMRAGRHQPARQGKRGTRDSKSHVVGWLAG